MALRRGKALSSCPRTYEIFFKLLLCESQPMPYHSNCQIEKYIDSHAITTVPEAKPAL